MDENNKFDVVGTNIAEKATMIWNVADMLRGPFKPHEYGLVILPMTVVKRFHDCLLPTHKAVLEQYEKVKNFAVIDGFLTKASGYQFYNISKYTFESLLADPENIEANFRDYLNGFSANVQDVLAKFDFDNIIRRMVESNTLYLVIKEFNSQKGYLGPDKISAVDCGYIFEDLVKRFSESFGEEAGAHFTSRDIIYLMTDLLLSDADLSKGGNVTVYDMAMGTSQMLSCMEERIQELNTEIGVGAEIAKLANGVALDKSNMIGEGRPFSNNNIQNTIFLFENGQENIVVDKFAELIFRSFSHDELEEYQKYGCHVLGMVHKIDKEMSVKNYFEEYNPEVKKQTPNHLIDYFWIAEEQMEKKGELSLKVEWISKGICKIMRKYPLKEIEKSSSAFNSIIKTVRPENREEIRSGLLEIMCMNWKTKNEWENVIDQILHLLSDVIKYTDARKDEFLFWDGSEKPEEYTKNRNRVNEKEYENESGDKINIKFGSIHSSKGRTHLTTLVVETKYYEDNLSSILPWLSGKRPKLGVRNKKRLKCHYVAMTRAKGLLCLAIPRKSVSDQVRKELENFGWNLEVV